MSHAEWRALLGAYLECQIDDRSFHNRFLDMWRRARDTQPGQPAAIDDLFYVVEAFCPDEALRNPASPYEVSPAELRRSAAVAMERLGLQSPLGN